MKTILCYGDSNTWGFDPSTGGRLVRDQRWPGVLRRMLGEGYEVIEEGLPGRTTVFNDSLEEYRSGKDYLIPCLYSHAPIDLVIIMLGTNDLKKRFALSASDIALGAGVLVNIVQKSNVGPNGRVPKVLLVAPPPIVSIASGPYTEMFEGADITSQKFSTAYRQITDLYQCGFLDAGTIITSSELDGIHFDASAHQKLGERIAENVKLVLG